jgi:hypothetical protein
MARSIAAGIIIAVTAGLGVDDLDVQSKSTDKQAGAHDGFENCTGWHVESSMKVTELYGHLSLQPDKSAQCVQNLALTQRTPLDG